MKNIELKISTDGYIICTYINNNKTRYVDYRVILNELYKLSKVPNKKLSIINGNITFATNDKTVIIESYSNNKDASLQLIIDKLKLEKIKRRKQELRKKKIKRRQMITASILLSAVTITSSLIGNNVVTASTNEEIDKEPSIAYEEDFDMKTQPLIIEEKEIVLEDKSLSNDISSLKNNKIEEDDINTLEVEFEDRTDTEKFKVTKAYYKEIITRVSKKYGIDPQIMLAIATQESGIHKINKNTPAIGLMQIEKSVWVDESITAYNYENHSNETIYITSELLEDLEFNIKVACMHFQKCLKDSKYNLALAIQMYNFGYGNLNNTLKMCYNGNINLKNVELVNDNEWLNYREKIDAGDKLYLERILSYIEDLENIEIETKSGTIHFCITNTNEIRHKI